MTKKKKEKKQRNKKTNATRTVIVEVEGESFFNFFKGQIVPEEGELDKMDSEEEDDLNEKIDKDFDIGNDIRDELIPEAFEHYLGIVEHEDEEMPECCQINNGCCAGEVSSP